MTLDLEKVRFAIAGIQSSGEYILGEEHRIISGNNRSRFNLLYGVKARFDIGLPLSLQYR